MALSWNWLKPKSVKKQKTKKHQLTILHLNNESCRFTLHLKRQIVSQIFINATPRYFVFPPRFPTSTGPLLWWSKCTASKS